MAVVVLVVAGLLAAVAALRDRSGDRGQAGRPDPTGTVAPATTLPQVPDLSFELFDGSTATLADYAGTPLVVNFWASWCPACVVELPDFQEVHERVGDEVTFIGLANADDRDAAVALADDVGLTYALGDDPAGEMFVAFELIAMPSTVFITADGRVHDTFGGQLDAESLMERIDDLLATSN